MSTKQTFEQTARVLRFNVESLEAGFNAGRLSSDALTIGKAVLNDTAREFARVYAQDNPRFDHDRFMRACGF